MFLKIFLHNWDFVKVILKLSFFNWYILRENCFETTRPNLDMLSNVYELHGVLDASKC